MIINLAICDDEDIQIEYLKKLIYSFEKENKLNINIKSFNSSESFLFYYEEDKNFDILLLDIEMGKINGIDLAKNIRKENENIQIVFITGFYDFISEGYDVNALHYLLKPVEKQKLFSVLNKAIKLVNKTETPLIFKIGNESVLVNKNDILFIEAMAHNSKINLMNGEIITVNEKISSLENTLGDEFIKCHRSYIASIKNIKKISKTNIIFDNDKEVPISRNLYNTSHKAFISYFLKEDN